MWRAMGGGMPSLRNHVFEHDSAVGPIESTFKVCIHDVDIFTIYFSVYYHFIETG
jgi:hypothetical protein